jgi:hypothetical protein
VRGGVVARFEREYGASNRVVNFTGQHSVVFVNSQVLGGARVPELARAAQGFLDALDGGRSGSMGTRVLVSHIPLYRRRDTPCGPLRTSSASMRESNSYHMTLLKYQNLLTQGPSDALLAATRPALVLSGHDHDHCDVVHRYRAVGEAAGAGACRVREASLGTFSFLQGNWFPSFALMTLAAPEPRPAGDGASCPPAPEDEAAVGVYLRICHLPSRLRLLIFLYPLTAGVAAVLLCVHRCFSDRPRKAAHGDGDDCEMGLLSHHHDRHAQGGADPVHRGEADAEPVHRGDVAARSRTHHPHHHQHHCHPREDVVSWDAARPASDRGGPCGPPRASSVSQWLRALGNRLSRVACDRDLALPPRGHNHNHNRRLPPIGSRVFTTAGAAINVAAHVLAVVSFWGACQVLIACL